MLLRTVSLPSRRATAGGSTKFINFKTLPDRGVRRAGQSEETYGQNLQEN
jgi:hypothetical protein